MHVRIRVTFKLYFLKGSYLNYLYNTKLSNQYLSHQARQGNEVQKGI